MCKNGVIGIEKENNHLRLEVRNSKKMIFGKKGISKILNGYGNGMK